MSYLSELKRRKSFGNVSITTNFMFGFSRKYSCMALIPFLENTRHRLTEDIYFAACLRVAYSDCLATTRHITPSGLFWEG
jgi:hypothetical protein